MDASRQIMFYGNSLILGTLASNIQPYSQIEVTVLKHPLPEAREIEVQRPDIVLFDLEVTRPETLLPLLNTLSDLVLIGVSPDKNQVRVWSGQQLQELSTQGLLEVILNLKGSTIDLNSAVSPVIPPQLTKYKNKEL